MKSHLLARIHGNLAVGEEPEYTEQDLDEIDFENDIIYPHATAAFNYTTYDIRRDHDTINVNTQRCNVMVLSNEDTQDSNVRHPFWYACVVGVYHAKVLYGLTVPRKKIRMQFLWVRWFGQDPEWIGGPPSLRLDRIGYVPQDDPSGAFGFLEPEKVVRGCHLIPAYALGKTANLLAATSKFRDSPDGDWTNYYVNR